MMINFIKNKWGLILIPFFFLLFILYTHKNEKNVFPQSTIDSLTKINNSKEDSILILNRRNQFLNNSFDSLKALKDGNDQKIIQIKQYYDQKIKSIDNYNDDSLYQFFTNRY